MEYHFNRASSSVNLKTTSFSTEFIALFRHIARVNNIILFNNKNFFLRETLKPKYSSARARARVCVWSLQEFQDPFSFS